MRRSARERVIFFSLFKFFEVRVTSCECTVIVRYAAVSSFLVESSIVMSTPYLFFSILILKSFSRDFRTRMVCTWCLVGRVF